MPSGENSNIDSCLRRGESHTTGVNNEERGVQESFSRKDNGKKAKGTRLS
jgi:hypothetical protein